MSWQSELKSEFTLDDKAVGRLDKLLDLLTGVSDRNLTAVTDPANMVDIHFRDSLSLIRLPEVSAASSAVDIGSGAGFPGLPLAIALPGLKVTLIEARRRKAEFIESAIGAIGLANATVRCARAEEAARSDLRDTFDVAFARAVGPMGVVLEYSLPLVRTGGSAILQRGARETGDETEASRVAALLGGSLDRIESTSPYPGAKNLHIWVFRKDSATPDRYPRRPGMPAKRPL